MEGRALLSNFRTNVALRFGRSSGPRRPLLQFLLSPSNRARNLATWRLWEEKGGEYPPEEYVSWRRAQTRSLDFWVWALLWMVQIFWLAPVVFVRLPKAAEWAVYGVWAAILLTLLTSAISWSVCSDRRAGRGKAVLRAYTARLKATRESQQG